MFAARPERYEQDMAGVEQLPEDLSQLDLGTLEHATNARDQRLSPLFRRWPSLSGRERSELKRLYNERLRLARHLGKRGRRAR